MNAVIKKDRSLKEQKLRFIRRLAIRVRLSLRFLVSVIVFFYRINRIHSKFYSRYKRTSKIRNTRGED